MIQIDDKIISTELFQVHFICDPARCLGACCVYGDSGAPLEKEESGILMDECHHIAEFITPEGRKAIKKQGTWVTDKEGDMVTPLIDGEECAYTVFEYGIAKCGIEIAYNAKSTPFRKPVSCHLYPIRVSKMGEFTAINYHRWHICDPARELGQTSGTPLFRFLKESIIRVWGTDFYDQMEIVYSELNKS